MVSSANWLYRYRAGQRDRIWHELRQLGSAVREPGPFEEAQLVRDEMARRARQNVEVIIERLSSADPLMIEVEGLRFPGEPIRHYFEGRHEAWREWAAQDPAAAGLFVLPLAPDRFHKENVSGGPPYGIILPDGSADGLFVGETTMPFVFYLNWVFRSGGFPWPTAPDNQWLLKQALARDLLPL